MKTPERRRGVRELRLTPKANQTMKKASLSRAQQNQEDEAQAGNATDFSVPQTDGVDVDEGQQISTSLMVIAPASSPTASSPVDHSFEDATPKPSHAVHYPNLPYHEHSSNVSTQSWNEVHSTHNRPQHDFSLTANMDSDMNMWMHDSMDATNLSSVPYHMPPGSWDSQQSHQYQLPPIHPDHMASHHLSGQLSSTALPYIPALSLLNRPPNVNLNSRPTSSHSIPLLHSFTPLHNFQGPSGFQGHLPISGFGRGMAPAVNMGGTQCPQRGPSPGHMMVIPPPPEMIGPPGMVSGIGMSHNQRPKEPSSGLAATVIPTPSGEKKWKGKEPMREPEEPAPSYQESYPTPSDPPSAPSYPISSNPPTVSSHPGIKTHINNTSSDTSGSPTSSTGGSSPSAGSLSKSAIATLDHFYEHVEKLVIEAADGAGLSPDRVTKLMGKRLGIKVRGSVTTWNEYQNFFAAHMQQELQRINAEEEYAGATSAQKRGIVSRVQDAFKASFKGKSDWVEVLKVWEELNIVSTGCKEQTYNTRESAFASTNREIQAIVRILILHIRSMR